MAKERERALVSFFEILQNGKEKCYQEEWFVARRSQVGGRQLTGAGARDVRLDSNQARRSWSNGYHCGGQDLL